MGKTSKIIFGLMVLLGFLMGARADVPNFVVSVYKSELQPAETIMPEKAIIPFASIIVDPHGNPISPVESSVVVRGVSDAFDNNSYDLNEIFSEIVVIANTSRGVSSAYERVIIGRGIFYDNIAYVSIDLPSLAEPILLTISGVTRGNSDLAGHNYEDISIDVIGFNLKLAEGNVAVDGQFPIEGSSQEVGAYEYRGYFNTYNSSIVNPKGYRKRALWVYADGDDIILSKVFFKSIKPGYKDKIFIYNPYNGATIDYDCVTDGLIAACNFYGNESELSPAKRPIPNAKGYLIPSGTGVYVYSNKVKTMKRLQREKYGLVAEGWNYRYRILPGGRYDDDGGKACFLAGTMVLMADKSEKDIKDIQSGDSVWISEGKSAKVAKVIKRVDSSWMMINNTATVPDQLFFFRGSLMGVEGEFLKPASAANIGDVIENDKGGQTPVEYVSIHKKEKVRTYDLVLDGGNLFYFADGCKVHSVVENIPED